MNPPSRPPNRSDGAVTATEESGGGDPPIAAAGDSASVRSSRLNHDSSSSSERSSDNPGNPGSTGGGGRGGEPESPARCRTKSTVDTLGVFRKRSIFVPPRRSSSGYFSFDGDSLPGSPRPVETADRATQTPSPACQAMEHARQRMAEARGGGGAGTQRLHGSSPSRSSTRQRHAAGDMQAEAVGQELRRIGDDFNTLLLLRVSRVCVCVGQELRRIGDDYDKLLMLRWLDRHRVVGRRVIRQIQLPHIPQEPTVLLCVGLLLLLGRFIYSMSSRDHSQV